MNKIKISTTLLTICFCLSTGWGQASQKFFSIAKKMGNSSKTILGTGLIDDSCRSLPSAIALNRVLQQKALAGVPLNLEMAAHPVELIGVNRTGVETLQTLLPSWKTQMRPLFSEEQIQLVQDAFTVTDKILFKEEGPSIELVNQEWNYAQHFAEELKLFSESTGIEFTEKQYKYLLGGKGAPSEGLWVPLRLMSLEGWLLYSGQQFPKATYWQNGKQVSAATLSEEELAQRHLAKGVDFLIRTGNPKNAIIARLIYLREMTRVNALSRTPQEWLQTLESWIEANEGRYPRANILHNGQLLSHDKLTPAEKEEILLASGVERTIAAGDPADPVIARLISHRDAGRVYSKRRTAEEWVTILENFVEANGRLPRGAFYKDGKLLKAAELSAEQVEERKLSSALTHYISKGNQQDPSVKRMIEIRNQYLKSK